MRATLYLLLFFLLSAESVAAAVSINEVAWMGSSASANHEWIELYNSGGSSVSVDGWTLKDGMNLSITLTGSIGAGSYAVLERTSEASAASTAFLIYSGALVNTGATLTLFDIASAVVDQVSGGEDWKNIGGDNVSKETAQYQSSGWVTDTATPGEANRAGRTETEVEEDNDEEENEDTSTPPASTPNTTSASRSSKSSDSVRLKNPEIKLNVLPDVQSVAYEHQAVPFNVRTNGIDDELEKLVRYEWNFGDSHVGEGKNPFHTYTYPGKYVVTVKAEYKKNVQVARHEITILPVSFSLSRTSEGALKINNDAKYDVDISGYTLRGSKDVVFPPRTIMASLSTITLALGRVAAFEQEMIGLYNTKNQLVAASLPAVGFANTQSVVSREVVSVPKSSALTSVESVPQSNSFGFGLATVAEASEAETGEVIAVEGELSVVEEAETTPATNRSAYFLFIVLLLLAFVSVLWPRNKNA